ncbi:hypothetical protein EB001_11245 [bacterium]|nr:hypothetical protein [bacterium]
MNKKKPKSDSSKPKKKTTPKKSCGEKCKRNCNNESPTLKSTEDIIKPESKTNYFFGLIKKAFGYGSDT